VFLQVNEAHGEAGAGVFGAPAAVVLAQAAVGVGRPAGVVGAVGAFEDVAEEGHVIRNRPLPGGQ